MGIIGMNKGAQKRAAKSDLLLSLPCPVRFRGSGFLERQIVDDVRLTEAHLEPLKFCLEYVNLRPQRNNGCQESLGIRALKKLLGCGVSRLPS